MCKWQVLNDYNILYGMICFWTETGEALLSIAKRNAPGHREENVHKKHRTRA
jgi:hypothetical protein